MDDLIPNGKIAWIIHDQIWLMLLNSNTNTVLQNKLYLFHVD